LAALTRLRNRNKTSKPEITGKKWVRLRHKPDMCI
jgi:hypothetical protein